MEGVVVLGKKPIGFKIPFEGAVLQLKVVLVGLDKKNGLVDDYSLTAVFKNINGKVAEVDKGDTRKFSDVDLFEVTYGVRDCRVWVKVKNLINGDVQLTYELGQKWFF